MSFGVRACIQELRLPRAGVASKGQMATGTHGRASEECHQNCHHSVHETVRSGASGCESGVNHGARSTHEKAPPGSGRADSSKRVPRFERPSCTLATGVPQTKSARFAPPVECTPNVWRSWCTKMRSPTEHHPAPKREVVRGFYVACTTDSAHLPSRSPSGYEHSFFVQSPPSVS